MSQLLQYNYASINIETGECTGCVTVSYEVNHPQWIQVPELGDYVGKYYNQADGLWYLDAGFGQIWEDAPQW